MTALVDQCMSEYDETGWLDDAWREGERGAAAE
jgi:hypothetical protein